MLHSEQQKDEIVFQASGKKNVLQGSEQIVIQALEKLYYKLKKPGI